MYLLSDALSIKDEISDEIQFIMDCYKNRWLHPIPACNGFILGELKDMPLDSLKIETVIELFLGGQ